MSADRRVNGIESGLHMFDPSQDICVTGGVLFQHIFNVVRLLCSIELTTSYKVLNHSKESDGILLLFAQSLAPVRPVVGTPRNSRCGVLTGSITPPGPLDDSS